ncbi:DUF262 domain-containing protein [Burkholderia anthina]|uniref:DUF262 domain-containing protein n=1 Tax=Burkholderia anthina TaxID=179879 RepID=UPI00158D757E|nr:DUF262 domain-containing protein [Burkholderia anthina]
MATEVKVYTPTLIDLCSCQALRTPIFQRPYGWLPEKAIEYLRDFLTNRKANNLFGSVFGYCQTPWNRATPSANEMFVTDGQHRLVTSTVVAIALLAERESRLAANDGISNLAEDTLDMLQELRDNQDHVEALSKIANANIEFMVDEDGTVANLRTFLFESDARIKALEAEIEKSRAHLIEVKSKASNRNLPRQAHARLLEKKQNGGLSDHEETEFSRLDTLTKDILAERAAIAEVSRATRNEETSLRAQIDKIASISLYAAYVGVQEHLEKLPLSALYRNFSHYAERQTTFSLALLVLEPKGNNDVDRVVLDDQAAEIFAQINGQTRPLTSPELLNSLFRSFKGFKADNPGEIAERLKSSEIVKFDGESLCDYIARYESNDGNTKASQWVRHLLAKVRTVGNSVATDAQQAVLDSLRALDSFQRFVLDTSNPSLKGYIDLYKMLVRIPISSIWVLTARVWEAAQTNPHPLAKSHAVKDLFKMSVLLRVASFSNRTTVNLTRDLANKQSLQDTFVYVANGFEFKANGSASSGNGISPDMVAHVRQALYDTLVAGEFGLPRQRNFARVLLAVADFESVGVKLAYEQASQFEFEHVLPQALESMQIEPGQQTDNDILQAQAEIEQMLMLGEKERTSLINRLGNGALLDKTSNISLGKLSPLEKLRIIDQKGMHNGYWPSHLQALRDSKGIVGQSYIEKRSQDFADQIVTFLLDLSFLSQAQGLTLAVA